MEYSFDRTDAQEKESIKPRLMKKALWISGILKSGGADLKQNLILRRNIGV